MEKSQNLRINFEDKQINAKKHVPYRLESMHPEFYEDDCHSNYNCAGIKPKKNKEKKNNKNSKLIYAPYIDAGYISILTGNRNIIDNNDKKTTNIW